MMMFPEFAPPIVKSAVRQWRRHLRGRWAGPGLDGSRDLITRASEEANYLRGKAKLQFQAEHGEEAIAASAKVALVALAEREAKQNKRYKRWKLQHRRPV